MDEKADKPEATTGTNPFERTIFVTAALAVLGALVALPSVVTEFPVNLMLIALSAGVSLFVPSIHRSEKHNPPITQLVVESAGPWVGYAVAFHLYHGLWDYQGIWIGLVGFAIMAPIVVAVSGMDKKADKSNEQEKPATETKRPFQFSIRRLMIVTAVVAVILAIATQIDPPISSISIIILLVISLAAAFKAMKRIKVVVPTFIILSMISLVAGIQAESPFSFHQWDEFWANCMMGPLAILYWGILQPVMREWLHFLSIAVPITVCSCLHSLKPHVITGIITVMGLMAWFLYGYAVNALGV